MSRIGFDGFLRAAILSGLSCVLLIVCSSAASIHDSLHADLILIGRVASSREIGVERSPDRVDDDALYDFRPLDQPDSSVEMVGTGKCPLATPSNQLYLVFLNKRPSAPGDPPEYKNLWEVIGCVPVDDKNSIGLLKAEKVF